MFMRTEFRAKTACNGARGLFVLLLGFGLCAPVGLRAEGAAAAEAIPISPESAPDVGSTRPETSPAPQDDARERTDPAEGGISADLQFDDAPATEPPPVPGADAAPWRGR
ncbi:hypothetical protein B1810_24025, partial [Panacagrimonas perspica]